jgi:hypothetical protein
LGRGRNPSSTLPSYYFDQRQSLTAFIEVTRKWWSEMPDGYEIFISAAVLQALSAGNYPGKREIVEFVSIIPLLPLSQNSNYSGPFVSL